MSGGLDGPGLVELLAGPNDPPDDLDILTESTEQDSWVMPPRPDGLDIETSAVESDGWVSNGPGDLDTITKSGAESDAWMFSPRSVGPRPSPSPRPEDLDGETFSTGEKDVWV